MRILVTGSTGFLGEHLCSLLAEQEVSFDRWKGDIAGIDGHPESADLVVHLAACTGSNDFESEPNRAFVVNVLGTQSVIEYCLRTGARCIFSSTSGVYLPSPEPVDENAPLGPTRLYPISKLLAEGLIQRAARFRNLKATILRFFNIYGPGQSGEFLIPYVVHSLAQGEVPRLRMPEGIRDFIYVRDACEAILRATQVQECSTVLNIGSGTPSKVAEAVHILGALMRREVHFDRGEVHPGENEATVAAIERATQELDWQPRVSLKEGLRRVIKS